MGVPTRYAFNPGRLQPTVIDHLSIRNYPKTVRRNFLLNWADGALFAFGLSLVSMVTVLPVFVKRLGGSNLLVGLIQVIWILGFNFPQIFVAGHARTLPYKKGFVLKTAIIQRLPWFLLALFSLWIVGSVSDLFALILFFFCFTLSAVAGGLNLPGWFDLIAKITPVRIRGRLFAMRVLFGALLGVFGGWIVKYVLGYFPYPGNFAILFLGAFTIMMVSYIFLILLKETESNPSPDRQKLSHFLRRLPQIVKKEHNFRNFLIADAFLIMALMSNGFYTLQALHRMQLSDDYVGYFTIVFMTSTILWNLIIGSAGDRLGHRLNLLGASVAALVASVLAVVAQSLWLYMLVFGAIALTQSAIQVSRMSIIAELCGEQDRSTHVSLANLVTSPFILVGLLGGWLADSFGYEVVFSISAVSAFTATMIWTFWVKEPRIKATVVINKTKKG